VKVGTAIGMGNHVVFQGNWTRVGALYAFQNKILMRSRRRLRNKNRWPLSGSCWSVDSTCPDRPGNPRRMSVGSSATKIFTRCGTVSIEASSAKFADRLQHSPQVLAAGLFADTDDQAIAGDDFHRGRTTAVVNKPYRQQRRARGWVGVLR